MGILFSYAYFKNKVKYSKKKYNKKKISKTTHNISREPKSDNKDQVEILKSKAI